jgi:chaperonin GroES
MKLKPLHDWTVLVPAEAMDRTAGGLFIPDSAKEKPREGTVEAVGPGALEEEKPGQKKKEGEERKFVPTVVKPGDRVLYESWAGQTITIGNEERVVVRERSILGLIDRPPQPAVVPALRPSTLPVERQAPPLPAVPGKGFVSTRIEKKPAKTKAKAKAKAKAKTKAKTKAKPAPKKAAKKSPAKKKTAKGRKSGKKK